MNTILNFLYRITFYWLFLILRRCRGFDSSFPISHPEWNQRGLALWYYRSFKPLLGLDLQYKNHLWSDDSIDVCIPALEKDSQMLKDVISSIRENIKHPVRNIYIVAPKDSKLLQEIATSFHCIFVDEQSIAPLPKADIHYIVNDMDRSGWLYQQLLKLSIDKISDSELVLICDADTMFIRDLVFTNRNKCIFNHSIERHHPYYETYYRIFNEDISSELSFVCHNMLFKQSWLKEMKKKIESIHNEPWWKVIINKTDYHNISGFSEYETYGNYCLKIHSSEIIREYWWNTTFLENCRKKSQYKTFSNHQT